MNTYDSDEFKCCLLFLKWLIVLNIFIRTFITKTIETRTVLTLNGRTNDERSCAAYQTIIFRLDPITFNVSFTVEWRTEKNRGLQFQQQTVFQHLQTILLNRKIVLVNNNITMFLNKFGPPGTKT